MRLEGGITLTRARHAMLFQFQIGAIRRFCGGYACLVDLSFQFQIGAIRSRLVSPKFETPTMFQFQIGAIRSGGNTRMRTDKESFNSKLVRLEA